MGPVFIQFKISELATMGCCENLIERISRAGYGYGVIRISISGNCHPQKFIAAVGNNNIIRRKPMPDGDRFLQAAGSRRRVLSQPGDITLAKSNSDLWTWCIGIFVGIEFQYAG